MLDIYKKRRQKLVQNTSEEVFIVVNPKKTYRNNDVYYPYRSNSDFYI